MRKRKLENVEEEKVYANNQHDQMGKYYKVLARKIND